MVVNRRKVEILYVDDSPEDRELMRIELARCESPHRLHFAEDGNEALAFVRRDRKQAPGVLPDLIILDLNMPHKDGFEVLAELKNDPALRRIPVVVLSTSRRVPDVDRAYELGASGFICKPDDIGDYAQMITAIESYWMKTILLPSQH
jgi:chemotaxis family two-component system response regulator Rcp1